MCWNQKKFSVPVADQEESLEDDTPPLHLPKILLNLEIVLCGEIKRHPYSPNKKLNLISSLGLIDVLRE
jgi:hypothetical protein